MRNPACWSSGDWLRETVGETAAVGMQTCDRRVEGLTDGPAAGGHVLRARSHLVSFWCGPAGAGGIIVTTRSHPRMPWEMSNPPYRLARSVALNDGKHLPTRRPTTYPPDLLSPHQLCARCTQLIPGRTSAIGSQDPRVRTFALRKLHGQGYTPAQTDVKRNGPTAREEKGKREAGMMPDMILAAERREEKKREKEGNGARKDNQTKGV
ncbi:hypothetical protein BKA81DRAFT_205122 [Phyllosticta paracitricarpa]|uniref:Uncharacterized protein n=1 Tax=Phyllosticta paracitricarpa TaxID=2016321 RepID=A0ABR1MT60_9PEZI